MGTCSIVGKHRLGELNSEEQSQSSIAKVRLSQFGSIDLSGGMTNSEVLTQSGHTELSGGSELKDAMKVQRNDSVIKHVLDFDFVQDDHKFASSIMPFFLKERVLGQGVSSEIAHVVRKSDGVEFAMKIMRRNDKWNFELFKQEYELLAILDHPNIVSYEDCYMDDRNFYLCTEFCKGGELHDMIKDVGKLTEVVTRGIILSIISAVAYCHSKNIVHRDLNPHNILFRSKERREIVIIDFGDAEILEENSTYSDFVSSAFYLSPESVRVRKGWELKKSDVWMIGVMGYIMLTGRPPFYGSDNLEILRKILHVKAIWPSTSKVSTNAKNFVNGLMNKNTADRPSAEQALQQKWLRFNCTVESNQCKYPKKETFVPLLGQHVACRTISI